MRPTFSLFIILVILLSSCTTPAVIPPTPTEQPTLVSTVTQPAPTAAPSPRPPSATPRPQAQVNQVTDLYLGPGNAGYPVLASLKPGDHVDPLGAFGDFVQVEFNGQQGFAWQGALDTSAFTLPALSVDQVPWQDLTGVDNLLEYGMSFDSEHSALIGNATENWHNYFFSAIDLERPFRLRTQITVLGKPYGAVSLFDRSETYNVWRGHIREVDIASDNGNLVLKFKDGTTENDVQEELPLAVPGFMPFTLQFLDPQGKQMVFLDGDGRQIFGMDLTRDPALKLPDGLFPEKKLYLSSLIAPGTQVKFNQFYFEQAPDGLWVAPPAVPSLRELAHARGISTEAGTTYFEFKNPKAMQILKDNFDLVPLGSFMNQDTWLAPDVYYFDELDYEVDYFLQHGFKIRGLNIMYGSTNSLPQWLLDSHYSRTELIEMTHKYVQAMVTHFKGRVSEWIVANEAASGWVENSQPPDFWRTRIGPDYIEMAFRWTREADPDAVLIFNDDGNDWPKTPNSRRIIAKMLSIVKDLKARGVPIDVVGMQTHLFMPWSDEPAPVKEEVIKTMRQFGDLGVKVYITEMDANLMRARGEQEERYAFQAEVYKTMVSACVESGVCTSFGTGVSDVYTWIDCSADWCKQPHPDPDPLLFDKNYQPKPAYFAVCEALGEETR